MNNIDVYNSNKIYNELNNYKSKIINEQKFDPNNFIQFMEQKFSDCGYRKFNEQTEILIIHDCGVGDFIMSTPAFREIRRIYSNAKISIILNKIGKQLAENCPYFDVVYTNEHPTDTHSFIQHYEWNMDLAHKYLLPHHYDIAFLFSYHSNSVLLSYMSGARRRISSLAGSGVWGVLSPKIATKFAEYLPIYNTINHDVDKFLSVLDSFEGVRIKDRNIECWCSYEDEVYAHDILYEMKLSSEYKFFALGIGGSVKRKLWPVEKYKELISKLLAYEKKAYFIVIGGKDDYENGCKLAEGDLSNNIINMAGKLTWTQSIAMMKQCEMYIGSDTSTLHFAAALKLPILTINCYPAELGLHNSAIPVKDRPYGVSSVTILPQYAMDECKNNNGHVSGCSRDNEVHCIKQITVDTVMKGYKLLLTLISTNSKEAKYIY